MRKYFNIFGIVLIDYLLIFICILPFAYAAGRVYNIVIAAFVSFICTFHGALKRSHTINIALGISSGFIISLILWGIFTLKLRYWALLEVEFLISFCVSFIIGMLPYSIGVFFPKHPLVKSEIYKRGILFFGIFMLLLSVLSFVLKAHNIVTNVLDIAIVRGIILGSCIGLLYSIFVRDWLLPSLNVFAILLEYIRAMFLPISAFFIGYFLIILTFAGLYGVLSIIDPSSFIGATFPWRFNEYIYYSIVSITTLGEVDIYAHAILAKWLTASEVIIGLMWTTVVLAATIAYLQRTFSQLAQKHVSNHSKK